MGKPKFPRKKYDTPLHPWKEDRIKSEKELIKKYGLKNHREIWKAKTKLKKHRRQARELLAKEGANDPQVKKEKDQLLIHLARMGITPQGSNLDDVLALETEAILSRRLQTLVYLKGFANTTDHSRQLISHGHIAVDNRKVTVPSYLISKDEEAKIGYTSKSVLNELSHPARPKSDIYTPIPLTKMKKEEKKEEAAEEKPTAKPVEEKPTEQPAVEEKPIAEQPKPVEKAEEPAAEKPGIVDPKKNETVEQLPAEKQDKPKEEEKSEKKEKSKEEDK